MCTPTASLPDFQSFEIKMQRILAEYNKTTSRQRNGDQTVHEAENQRKAIVDLATSFQILLANLKVFFTKYEVETREEQLRCSYQRYGYEKAHLRRLMELADPDVTLLLEPTLEESQPIRGAPTSQLVDDNTMDDVLFLPDQKKMRLSRSPVSTAIRNAHQPHTERCRTIYHTSPRRTERLSCGASNLMEPCIPANVNIKTDRSSRPASRAPISKKLSPSVQEQSKEEANTETGSNSAESIHYQTSEKNAEAPSVDQYDTPQVGPSNDTHRYDSQNEQEKHDINFRNVNKFNPDAAKNSNGRKSDWDKFRERARSQQMKRNVPPTTYTGDAKGVSVIGAISKQEQTNTLLIEPPSSKTQTNIHPTCQDTKTPEPAAKRQITEEIIKMITTLEGKPSDSFNIGKINQNPAKKVKIAPYVPQYMQNSDKNVKIAFVPQNCSTPLPNKDRIPVGIENQTTDISEIPQMSTTDESIAKNNTDPLHHGDRI